MLMRSHNPIHGVGRLASDAGRIPEGQRAERDEDHDARDGVDGGTASRMPWLQQRSRGT